MEVILEVVGLLQWSKEVLKTVSSKQWKCGGCRIAIKKVKAP